MSERRMKDVIVVLPGIMGSVLQKHGKDVWAPPFTIATRLFNREQMVRELKLEGDDPDLDDLDDGVRATALLSDIHLIPGLWKIDGYSTTWKYLQDSFDVTAGQALTPNPSANLFPFPYDWRRDNRVSARKLKQFIDQQLPLWRQHTGNPDARVILIAHSMGGLVSRYYLEVLGGWEYCRALLTFGTPYQGSLNALGFIVNGYKMLFFDLTEVVRSFTSVYQLLPTYPVLQTSSGYVRVAESPTPLPNMDMGKAQQALAFHRAIRRAAEGRLRDPARMAAYATIPIVGTQQPTGQMAWISDGKLLVGTGMPATLADAPGFGDGTVPYVSSIPAELISNPAQSLIFAAEQHGALQARPDALEQLRQELIRLQAGSWAGVLKPDGLSGAEDPVVSTRPAIGMEVDDLFAPGEPVVLQAQVHGPITPVRVEAVLTPDDATLPPSVQTLQPVENGWATTIEGLAPGLYRVQVRADLGATEPPAPVHDVFEIAGEAAPPPRRRRSRQRS